MPCLSEIKLRGIVTNIYFSSGIVALEITILRKTYKILQMKSHLCCGVFSFKS